MKNKFYVLLLILALLGSVVSFHLVRAVFLRWHADAHRTPNSTLPHL